jgi:hypothetical protein
MPTTDPRVDAYIRAAAPFARPILQHLRDVVHEACPGVEETMKWSFPHFDYKRIFCSMAAFKQHATFGFWKGALLADRLPAVGQRAMGQFGRITSLDGLPDRKTLVAIIKAAARLNDKGVKLPRAKLARARKPIAPPADFEAALATNERAQAAFEAFSPSHQREYIEWVVEAKQDATRARRIATSVEWLAQGKPRNWKYMR